MSGGRLLAVAALLVLLVGIGVITALAGREVRRTQAALPVVSAQPGFPRQVRLWDGHELELAAAPQRILPANAGAADLVMALVAKARLVALPDTAFADGLAAESPETWSGLPTFAKFTAETVLALQPDLVICDPFAAAETLVALRGAGLSVVTVPHPTSWTDLLDTIAVLGQLLGCEPRAAELTTELQTRAARLSAGASARSGLRVLSYTNFGSGGWTAGAGTTVEALLALVGVRNAATEAGFSGHQPLDYEQLLSLDPDILLMGAATASGQAGRAGLPAALARLRAEPALAGLRALRQEAVVVLPAPLFGTTSHRLLDAAETLAASLDALSVATDSPVR
ncbi:MAG: ABC transporter substrate-binding protein [Planctomycetota bacterium]